MTLEELIAAPEPERARMAAVKHTRAKLARQEIRQRRQNVILSGSMVLTAYDVAAALGISYARAIKLIRTGEIHGFKLCQAWRVSQAEFDAFLARQIVKVGKAE